MNTPDEEFNKNLLEALNTGVFIPKIDADREEAVCESCGDTSPLVFQVVSKKGRIYASVECSKCFYRSTLLEIGQIKDLANHRVRQIIPERYKEARKLEAEAKMLQAASPNSSTPAACLDMLSFEGVENMLKPPLKDLWNACKACIDKPSEQSMEEFRKLCRPADVMLLLRVTAENNREDRLEPFRVL
jgi:hypothetical protein